MLRSITHAGDICRWPSFSLWARERIVEINKLGFSDSAKKSCDKIDKHHQYITMLGMVEQLHPSSSVPSSNNTSNFDHTPIQFLDLILLSIPGVVHYLSQAPFDLTPTWSFQAAVVCISIFALAFGRGILLIPLVGVILGISSLLGIAFFILGPILFVIVWPIRTRVKSNFSPQMKRFLFCIIGWLFVQTIFGLALADFDTLVLFSILYMISAMFPLVVANYLRPWFGRKSLLLLNFAMALQIYFFEPDYFVWEVTDGALRQIIPLSIFIPLLFVPLLFSALDGKKGQIVIGFVLPWLVAVGVSYGFSYFVVEDTIYSWRSYKLASQALNASHLLFVALFAGFWFLTTKPDPIPKR